MPTDSGSSSTVSTTETASSSTTTTTANSNNPQHPSSSAGNSVEQTPAATPVNISDVFDYHRWTKVKKRKQPSLQDRLPLALFFHADLNLNTTIRKLKKTHNAHCIKFARLLDHVHRLQKLLLDTVYLIYVPIPEECKATREYRQLLPYEDQAELDGQFSENILFAAQAIAAGFRVRGIERHNGTLKEPARLLCAAFDALRFVFRRRSLVDPRPPHGPELLAVLRDFDWAWTRFEQRICFCYFSLVTGQSPASQDRSVRMSAAALERNDLFSVLLSETIMRSLTQCYFSGDDLQGYEPFLMIAIPRLALVGCLVHFPDYYPLPADCDNGENAVMEEQYSFFDTTTQSMKQLKSKLALMNVDELAQLELLLVDSCRPLEDNSIEKATTVSEVVQPVFLEVSGIADKLQSSAHSQNFTRLLSRVFLMHQHEHQSIKRDSTPQIAKTSVIHINNFQSVRLPAWRSEEAFPRASIPAGITSLRTSLSSLNLRPSLEADDHQ